MGGIRRGYEWNVIDYGIWMEYQWSMDGIGMKFECVWRNMGGVWMEYCGELMEYIRVWVAYGLSMEKNGWIFAGI